jgi:uncharacterized protein YbaP (TraB family)
MHRSFPLAILTALALTAFCARGHGTATAVPAGQPPAAQARSEAPRKSFLWEVRSPTNTVHLFGTIHVGKKEFFPLPPAVEAALKQAAKLVVEADITDQGSMAELVALMTYAPPETLEKYVPAALFARVNAQAARLKLPAQSVRALRPFMAAGMLSVSEFARLGYEAQHGVDAYLIRSARAAMKPVLELESVAGQIRLLAAMPDDLQLAFLDNTLTTLESGLAGEQVIGAINAWQSGDLALMQAVADSVAKGGRELQRLDEILIHGRNVEILKKIEGYLREKEPHFVATGSLHLAGPRGLVAQLKAKGYEVTQK